MNQLRQRLYRVLEFLLAMSLLTIAIVIVSLVVMRYVFNTSITGANEFSTILFAYATSIGSAVALGRGEHIAIDVAVDRLPDSVQRLVSRLTIVLVGFLNLVLLIESIGWIQITGDYIMPATGLARKVSQVCIPLGCGLACLFCLFELFSPGKNQEASS